MLFYSSEKVLFKRTLSVRHWPSLNVGLLSTCSSAFLHLRGLFYLEGVEIKDKIVKEVARRFGPLARVRTFDPWIQAAQLLPESTAPYHGPQCTERGHKFTPCRTVREFPMYENWGERLPHSMLRRDLPKSRANVRSKVA